MKSSNKANRSRRGTVGGALVGVLALALAACGGGGGGGSKAASTTVDLGGAPPVAGEVEAGALKGKTLTFVSYGGIYQDGQAKAAVEPFGVVSGAKILEDGPTDNAKLRAQVESKNVTWDVVDTTNVFAAGQCGKLFQPLDTSIVDTSKIPKALLADKCSVPAMSFGLIVMYNKKKFGANPPTTWADFYDTAKYPGKRGIEGQSSDVDPGVLEGALLADGVAPSAMYPLDATRAIKKMDSIRKDSVFWSTGAQAQQLLESGQVDMAMLWSGRAYSAVKNGAPYAPMWNQWMPAADAIVVPMNAPNAKASMALLNYYVGAKQQAKLTELTSYSPINIDSKPKLTSLAMSFLTTTPERAKDAFPIDFGWWATNHDAMVTAYTKYLAG